jgi:hypothetical protein
LQRGRYLRFDAGSPLENWKRKSSVLRFLASLWESGESALRKQGFAPKLLVTDKLRSYGSAFRRLRLTCPHKKGFGATIGRELAPAWTATRAQDAAVQIGSVGQFN